jgi:CubicO group peptidase (beta-lactamase class C family)
LSATSGLAPDPDFEICSISKGITGLLYADACTRSEIRPGTTWGSCCRWATVPSPAGSSRSGRAKEPWAGEAMAPAGGIRASIRDMARLARTLLDGSAPGLSALDPVADFTGPAARIGPDSGPAAT